MGDETTTYPLGRDGHSHLQRLGQILWNWELCGNCLARPACSEPGCPWSRAGRLKKFWDRYKDATAAYTPDFLAQQPALTSHGQLLTLINEIKIRRDVPRAQLLQSFYVDNSASPTRNPTSVDQSKAFSLGASILFLMSCGAWQDSADMLEDDTPPFPWRDSMAAKDFVIEAFPKKLHPYFDCQHEQSEMRRVMPGLAAVQLKKNAGLRLQATTDLRSHLKMDLKQGMVLVFDCTAVLKEILIATLVDPDACIIPRSLVLEVLDTIHNVLFPPDHKSQALLSSLVQKHNLDEDMLRYEFARYRRKDDTEVTYSYFGTRLADIYDEMQNPTPRRSWESWFQKYSAPRYMLLATMIGVFIAVIIGILGLGISGFQAWVSYQQWKHPVEEN